MSWLLEQGIVQKESKTSEVFESLVPYFSSGGVEAHQSVQSVWAHYQSNHPGNNSQNGKVFEYLIASLLLKEGITPFFVEADILFVPNVSFDLAVYSKECGPIVISAKTSLRERYKQAALEAIALKYVHRKAKTFLVTLNVSEAASVNQKIRNGDVIGIEKVVVATEPEFSELLRELKAKTLIVPEKVDIISANRVIRGKHDTA